VNSGRDVHSFSEPWRVRVVHCSLELDVDFESRQLRGTALLTLERLDPAAPVVLDTRDLDIQEVTAGEPLTFTLGPRDPILGSRLSIDLPAGTDSVLIRYSTSPKASGLQWLEPHRNAGKEHPFLFSQSQSIHARSWMPIQDSPGVRVTYDARIKAPKELRAIMSAQRDPADENSFKMELPIPAYLIALAVGALEYAPLGPRTGIYAEACVLPSALREFADTEKLVETVESLYGPYRWGRYELLILPPSFPFGGMENPIVTFVTPTVIAGDKSLVSLISHELAHSWSGNLVTNATWRDFWLNEGFTTYIENRIQEEVYGREQALMEQVLDRRELDREIAELGERDQILHIDLAGRDPDEGCTRIPYIKGALLLRQMEMVFGRPAFDHFLGSYFEHFAFSSITTAEALEYIRRELLDRHPNESRAISLHEWVFEPDLPACAPRARSEALEKVADGPDHAAGWNTQQWLEYLQTLKRPVRWEQMKQLDDRFHLTRTGNYEILAEWLLMAIESGYEPADERLHEFLLSVGRMKYLRPLYAQLKKSPGGRERALVLYREAKPLYHPIAQTAIERLLFLEQEVPGEQRIDP
jgi:leukotriene-A4 hydrolase